MTIDDIKIFNRTKTLQELEYQLEFARINFFDALATDEPQEMVTKYLNAYKLASDMYYARKWNNEQRN